MDRLVYDRMNQQEAVHWWFVARRDLIRTTIERLIPLPKGGEILEAGCGTGGNIAMLMSLGHLDAFEFDEQARVIASEKGKCQIAYGALPDDIPFAGKSYDLVGLFDVLEHIQDDQATLAGLGARLRPGGKLLVTVPALPWLWSKHDVRHHHFRRYTRKSLRKVAEAAGLQVEQSFYFNTFLLPVAMALRGIKALTRSQAPDDTLPGPGLNKALYTVFSSERHLIGRLRMPIGLSVCAILVRPATGP
jgi:SAM-dependent methyltransferase